MQWKTWSYRLFFPRNCGNLSRMTVMTVSVVENCVPNPRESNIRKNRIDQRGEIGILETASGYAINANPAPFK